MNKGIRKAGEFCWINMLTPRPAEAREFFGTLLGWTYDEMPGMGHSVKVGGEHIGGLFDLEGPNTPPGLSPIIGVMVKVESADDACEKVRSLGGRVARSAFDIMDRGRMAVCHDPNGAPFDLWEPRKLQGTDVDIFEPGAPCWFETLTTDVDRAGAFYSELFGWTIENKPMPGDWSYTTFKLAGEPVAGMMPILPKMGPVKPHWATNFAVMDVDATANLAVELGATLFLPPRDVPGIARFCGIASPQGVMFYAVKFQR